ncbi:unnamed protein product [Brassica oleracea]
MFRVSPLFGAQLGGDKSREGSDFHMILTILVFLCRYS